MNSHSLVSSLFAMFLASFYPVAIGWVVKQHNDAMKTIANIHNETIRQVAGAGLSLATSLAAGGAAQAGTWTEKHGIAPAAVTSSLIGGLATGQAPVSEQDQTPAAPRPPADRSAFLP